MVPFESLKYSYFSPEFYLGEDGMPADLPERGPLGALVNEPAFRSIPRIAASDSSQTGCGQDGGGDTFYRDIARDRGLGDHTDEDAAKMALVEAFPALYPKFLEQENARRHADAVSAGSSATVQRSIEGRAEALVAAGSARNIDEALGMVAAADPKSYERYGAVLAIERAEAVRDSRVTAAAEVVGEVMDRARALVAGGDAANETEGAELVFAADGALYGRYLEAGCPDLWA